MKSDNRLLLAFLIVISCLVSNVEAICTLQGCSSCNFNLINSAFAQSCIQCITGYKLNSSNVCEFDVGLIVGLSLGAVVIIAVQIMGFCLCQLYFKHKFRKPVQYTLQQIFEELEQQKYNPNTVQELNQKYRQFINPQRDPDCPEKDCFYCSQYEIKYQNRKGWPKFSDYEKWKQKKEQRRRKNLQSNQELNSQNEQQYPEVNPKGPTVKLDSCKHFYHLPCLKKQIKSPLHMDKQNRDPHDDAPSCICNQDLSEIIVMMICRVCKTKERRLKFRLKQKGAQGLIQYTCAVCYDKMYKEEEKNKWINKIIQ